MIQKMKTVKRLFASRFLKGKRGEVNGLKTSKIGFTARTALNGSILNVSE